MKSVSVVIPVFNPGHLFLRRAIESILIQEGVTVEVVVVDDGSTDGSVDEAMARFADPRLKWVRQANAGKSAAMNLGISQASFNLVAVQDADDFSEPRRLVTQALALEKFSAGIAFCGYSIILGERRLAPHVKQKGPEECRRLIDEMRLPGHDPTVMFNRSIVGNFEYCTDTPFVEGVKLLLELGERVDMINVGGPFYGYRIHPDSITKRSPERRDFHLLKVYNEVRARRGLPELSQAGSRVARADNSLYRDFCTSVLELKECGRWIESFRVGLSSLGLAPTDVAYYLPLAHAVCPQRLKGWLKTIRDRRQDGA